MIVTRVAGCISQVAGSRLAPFGLPQLRPRLKEGSLGCLTPRTLSHNICRSPFWVCLPHHRGPQLFLLLRPFLHWIGAPLLGCQRPFQSSWLASASPKGSIRPISGRVLVQACSHHTDIRATDWVTRTKARLDFLHPRHSGDSRCTTYEYTAGTIENYCRECDAANRRASLSETDSCTPYWLRLSEDLMHRRPSSAMTCTPTRTKRSRQRRVSDFGAAPNQGD